MRRTFLGKSARNASFAPAALPIALPIAVIASALCLLPSAAQATAPARVWVSVNGLDSNPCTGPSPCRTLTFAASVVAPGGEIDVATPGGYGPLTITSALTINAEGVGPVAISAAANGNGITVNAGSNDHVFLNGLSIDGGGIGFAGIVFNSGGQLSVTNCNIRHFAYNSGNQNMPGAGSGIAFLPTSSYSALLVTNSTLSDNGNFGVVVQPPVGSVNMSVTVAGSALSNNSVGGLSINTINLTSGANEFNVSNNVLDYNGYYAITARNGSDTSSVAISNNLMNGNPYGTNFSGTPAVSLYQNVINGAGAVAPTGWGVKNTTSPNSVTSFGGNLVVNNATNFAGTALLTGTLH